MSGGAAGNSGDYQDVRRLIARGRTLLDRIDVKGPPAIRAAVKIYRPPIPVPDEMKDWLAEQLIGTLHDATDQARDALTHAESMVDQAGSPSGLRALADAIDAGLGAKARALTTDVRKDKLEAVFPDAWSGRTSELYRLAFDGQNEAVGRIATYSDSMAKVLRGLADQLEAFVGQVAAEVVVIVGAATGLVASLLAATSVVAAAAAIWGLVAATVGLAGAYYAMLMTLFDNAQKMAGLIKDAKPAIQAWPASRFGRG